MPGSIDLSDYEDDDEEESDAVRYKRSIDDDEDPEDDLDDDVEEDSVDVPVGPIIPEGGEGSPEHGETSPEQPIAFLKVKQRGRKPDRDLLDPSKMLHG